MADIFLSYSRADRARVVPLVEGLQARGWSVWWDRDIAPGRGFEEEIDREISAARCVLVVWSNDSVNSRWVRNEALEGLERNILVPVLLDDVRIPVAFRQSQAVDFRPGVDTSNPAWDALVNVVRDFTGGDTSPSRVIQPPPSVERPTIAVLPFQSASGDVAGAYACAKLSVQRDPRYFGSRVVLSIMHLDREEVDLALGAMADAKRLRPELTRRQLEGLVGEPTTGTMAGHGLPGVLDS